MTMLSVPVKDSEDLQFAISDAEEVILVLLVWEVELCVHGTVATSSFRYELDVSLMEDLSESLSIRKMLQKRRELSRVYLSSHLVLLLRLAQEDSLIVEKEDFVLHEIEVDQLTSNSLWPAPMSLIHEQTTMFSSGSTVYSASSSLYMFFRLKMF